MSRKLAARRYEWLAEGRLNKVCVLVFLFIASFVTGCSTHRTVTGLDSSDWSSERLNTVKDAGKLSLSGLSVLDVNSAITVAMESNPDIVALREVVRVAEARTHIYPGLRDPEIKLSLGQGERLDETLLSANSTDVLPVKTENSDGYAVGLRFFLPNPWMSSAKMSAERADFNAAIADLRAKEWQVSSTIRTLFVDIQYYQDDLAAISALSDIRRQVHSDMTNLVAHGQSTLIESLAAAEKYIQVLSQQNKLEADLSMTRSELAKLLGRPVTALRIEGDRKEVMTYDLNTLEADMLTDSALVYRQEIVAARMRWQSALAVLNEARTTRFPWFTYLEGSYGRNLTDEESLDVLTKDMTRDEWRVGAGISIPLFELGYNAIRVQETEAQGREEAMFSEMKLVVAEVYDALTVFKRADAQMKDMELQVLPRFTGIRGLLKSVEEGKTLTSVELARLKEIDIEYRRLVLQSRHECKRALKVLEQTLGTQLKPKQE